MISHHQGVGHHHLLASDFLSNALLKNEDPSQTPNKPRSSVLSLHKIIQDETLKRVAVKEILVQEMAKRVVVEDKYYYANDRINNADHETWPEKHASNILIQNENKKDRDIMEDVQFMMKESQ